MAENAEVIAEIESKLALLLNGNVQDIITDDATPGEYPTALKYDESAGGFFITWKAGGQPDIFVTAESAYNILKANAEKVLSSPNYVVDKATFGQTQLTKIQAIIATKKA